MPGQAKREIPRWQQRRPARQAPGRQAPGRRPGHAGGMPAVTGVPVPRPAMAGTVPAAVTPRRAMWRYRYQVVPFAWLAWMLAAGPGLHLAGKDRIGVAAGLASGALAWLLTRHLRKGARGLATAMAAVTALWVPLLALAGWTAPLPPLFLACWAAVLVPWLRRYRWRREAAASAPVPHLSDMDIWDKLAARRHWAGRLGECEEIPNGRRWSIILDGSETDIGDVMSQPRKVAAAYGKAMTEAFVEPRPDGVESGGYLTLLRRGTLAAVREWDGAGIDPATGIAVIGRYADGSPARIRVFAPRDGAKHGLIAGTSGGGKTYALDLLIRVCLASGFIVPVVLDPQEGQSLPQWRGHVPYASGVLECMAMLRGLQAGMLDRSRVLSSMTWADTDGHQLRGLDFYDHEVTGLPLVLVIGDEYPVLLTDRQHGAEAVSITADLGKRGRKTGVSLWPVAQVPSLAELGDQVVRSMLVGGNVICLRTGDRVSASMLGLDADPSALPRYFPDGSPTYGLGYVIGPDMRQAVGRIDLVPQAMRRVTPPVPSLDPAFAVAMARAMEFAPVADARLPFEVIQGDDEPAPEGRSCADAILAVLTAELDRAEIIRRAAVLVTREWGRERPFSVRSFTDALPLLVTQGRITKTSAGVYAPARASLTVVAGSPGATA